MCAKIVKKVYFCRLKCERRSLKRALVVELVDTQDLKSCDHCGRAGSSPARGTKLTPRCTNKRGSSSVGRARPCQGRGREFESRFPLQRESHFGSLFCFKSMSYPSPKIPYFRNLFKKKHFIKCWLSHFQFL